SATPTATIDATLQTSAPTNGTRESPPSSAKPAASASGRRAGATLLTSFCPTSRKIATMPKILATTAIAADPSAIGIATALGSRGRGGPRRQEQRQHAERAGEERSREVLLRRHRGPRERRREEIEERERDREPRRERHEAQAREDRPRRSRGRAGTRLLPGRA